MARRKPINIVLKSELAEEEKISRKMFNEYREENGKDLGEGGLRRMVARR